MRRWVRTGAALVLGAGLGVWVGRATSLSPGEEQRGVGGLLERVPVIPVIPGWRRPSSRGRVRSYRTQGDGSEATEHQGTGQKLQNTRGRVRSYRTPGDGSEATEHKGTGQKLQNTRGRVRSYRTPGDGSEATEHQGTGQKLQNTQGTGQKLQNTRGRVRSYRTPGDGSEATEHQGTGQKLQNTRGRVRSYRTPGDGSEATEHQGTGQKLQNTRGRQTSKTRESYVTSYDPRTRTASWVIERLSPASLSGQSDRNSCDFMEDDSVNVLHRSTNADYRGSGFDRGHMAAAANHKWSQKAMQDTFYLSNVAPQKHCRSLTKNYLNVYVCHRPPLPAQVLGHNHVAVPTHFFKVLILEQMDGRGVELRSYVLPNEPIEEKVPLERFLVPIETIERAAGLQFVPNIMKRTSRLQSITAR
ncbi:hypothetical protein KUCAC02_034817 [Chaenocephalus aceratus]|nr:hypothetical protein KUCAC02_034817 [Chaenocephalus aceratus]